MRAIWGIDLGGTKIEGVILDQNNLGKVIARKRIPTEAHLGYHHIVNRIVTLIKLLAAKTGHQPTALGIGTPGSVDPRTGTMKNSNTVCLIDKSLLKDLESKLGIPVVISNDANCFAVAETNMGVIQRVMPTARVVVGLIMGTGTGAGIVIDGKVWEGKNGIGGEWGHNFLDESGGDCYCGKVGCVETVISGPSLERYYHSQSGKKRSMKAIFANHLKGIDPIATATVQRLLTHFGKALSVIINFLDPDAIVIGGGLGNIDLMYTEGRAMIEKNVFNPYLETPILKPALGDSAGVFGAAMLVKDH